MKFTFRRNFEIKKSPPVTLVLQTEDPLLYRIGAATKYPDIDTKELNALLRDTLEKEFRKVHRIEEMLDSETFQKTREKLLEDLRIEARELFGEMDIAKDDREELVRLNDMFSDVMRRKREVETAFSPWNPWLEYYRKLEWKERKKALARGLEGIIVHATILDKDWFEHPAYPIETKGRHSLRNTRALPVNNGKADTGTGNPVTGETGDCGRDKRQKWEDRGWERAPVELTPPVSSGEITVSYVEPALKILSYEPVVVVIQ